MGSLKSNHRHFWIMILVFHRSFSPIKLPAVYSVVRHHSILLHQFDSTPSSAAKFSTNTILPKMNGSESSLRSSIKSLPSPLLETKHKGEAGRIGIIGGSLEYTGAPYYAAITALKCGADLAYVFCMKDAAIPIKSYSPELIVLPYLDAADNRNLIAKKLTNIHSLVIGPGLGEDYNVHSLIVFIIKSIENGNYRSMMTLVFDADGLGLLADNKDLLKNYQGHVYLTPNANEIKKLAFAYLGLQDINIDDEEMLKKLVGVINPNATLILKGQQDRIVTASNVYLCSVPGSMRRCGGQGDVLSGSLGLFSYWATLYENRDDTSYAFPAQIMAAYAACSLTRTTSRLAFEEHGRSTTTTDMIGYIQKAYENCLG